MNKNETIKVAWIDGGQVSGNFASCLITAMKETEFNIVSHSRASSVLVSRNRNRTVRDFLQTGEDWLLMLDSDLVFTPQTLDTLFASADKKERPFVNGWYHLILNKNQPHAYPDVFIENEDGSWGTAHSVGHGQLLSVMYVGFGAALMHRNFLHALTNPQSPDMGWFQDGPDLRQFHEWVGEDFYFCARAREAGYDVWVNTSAYFGHEKSIVLSQSYSYPDLGDFRYSVAKPKKSIFLNELN